MNRPAAPYTPPPAPALPLTAPTPLPAPPPLTAGELVRHLGAALGLWTAAGVTFMTLEDETGFVNLVVWSQVFDDYATIVRTASLLGVTGKLQVQEGIVHLIAERVWVPALSRPVVDVASRDFH